MARGTTRGRVSAEAFLSARAARTRSAEVGEFGGEVQLFQKGFDAGGEGGITDSALRGSAGDGGESHGDGLSVGERVVAAELGGVSEGVAEVEEHALAGFEFVAGDDAGFHLDAFGEDGGEGRGLRPRAPGAG